MREKGVGRTDARLRKGMTGMPRQENGYITITAGMPDNHGGRSAHVDRLLSREKRRTLALRLRSQGWSYRRISNEMALPYATILQWLDDDPAGPAPAGTGLPVRAPMAAAVPVVVPIPAPSPVPAPLPSASPVAPAPSAEIADMAARIDRLTAAHEAQQAALVEMEARLVAAMEAQHRTLADRLMESIKAMIAKILPV